MLSFSSWTSFWRGRIKDWFSFGPGLANGLANLHNAKKANSGIVNVVGQHALQHIAYDAPLNSDIEALASPMSHWVKTSKSAKNVSFDGAEAIRSSIDNGTMPQNEQ